MWEVGGGGADEGNAAHRGSGSAGGWAKVEVAEREEAVSRCAGETDRRGSDRVNSSTNW